MSEPRAGSIRASERSLWLFSAPVDLAVFLGSALVALALLPLGAQLGVLYGDAPEWTWIVAVLVIDVAHVWSTTFRVYLDREELSRRPWLYGLIPLFAWIGGVTLYSESALTFWRVLAYMAVFHFVRQQYGWVMLYRARAGERGRTTRIYDSAVVYAATVFPLLYWHAHLPREFWWFIPNDFSNALSGSALVAALEPCYWLLMGSYLVRTLYLFWLQSNGRNSSIPGLRFNPGKDIVVITTALCWYIGIIAINSDYAFTVTNVIIHGVPYFALVYWYGRKRYQSGTGGPAMTVFRYGPWLFLSLLWLVAYLEELLWERLIWHDRPWLFGDGLELSGWQMYLVPLLALPQATHYLLDGFIWKRRDNPEFSDALERLKSRPTG